MGTPSTGTARPARRGHDRNAALDGLRAVAVVAVFAYHLFPAYIRGGYLGVDVFFVLSGFLITSLILRERTLTGAVSLRGFWVRRARRILPAAFTVMVVSCSCVLLASPDLRVGIWQQILGICTFSTNWVQIATSHSYFDAQIPQLFVHYWSLAVEEQFYVVWPLLLLAAFVVFRGRRVLLTLAIAALAVGSGTLMATGYRPGVDPSSLYYGTHTHAFGLLLGAFLATLLTSQNPSRLAARWTDAALPWRSDRAWTVVTTSAAGVVAVAFLSLRDTSALAYHWGIFAVCAATALVVAGCALGRGALARLLTEPALVWIGRRSYSMYLWHWPVFVILTSLLDKPAERQSGVVPVATIVLTVVLSAASYRFVELPFQTKGYAGVLGVLRRPLARPAPTRRGPAAPAHPRFRWQPVGVAFGIVALTSCTAVTAYAVTTAPHRTSVQEQLELLQQLQSAQQSENPDDAPAAPRTPRPLPSGDQIAVIGDSVALGATESFVRAFPGMQSSQVDAAVSRSYLAVPDIVGALQSRGALRPVVILALGANGPDGAEYVRAVLDQIGPDHLVVVMNAYSPHPANDAIDQGIAEAVAGRDNVELGDWYSAIAPRTDLLAADRTHPSSVEGQDLYASVAQQALQRLVDRHPLP